MRAGDRAEQVMGVLDGRDPVAESLVDGVLQGAAAGRDRDDVRAEELHPRDVQRLALGVFLAHVDRAVEAEQRGGGGGGHPVLAGAGLGDDPLLAHAHREQRLPEHIVDLVRAGVGEVLALEQNAGAAGVLGEPARVRDRGGPARVSGQQPSQLRGEHRVGESRAIRDREFVERRDERLRDEPAAERAEVARRVWQLAHRWPCRNAGWAPAVTRSATACRGSLSVTRPSPTRTASAPAEA